MLTGYNTDIRHQGTIFHIQTEDGGETNPVIVSLVYQGGRILASRKTSYARIVGTEDFLSQIRTMLEDQHRAMIRAVKTGTLPADTGPEASSRSTDMATETSEVNEAPPPASREPESFKEKNLDQVILEYLASELDEE